MCPNTAEEAGLVVSSGLVSPIAELEGLYRAVHRPKIFNTSLTSIPTNPLFSNRATHAELPHGPRIRAPYHFNTVTRQSASLRSIHRIGGGEFSLNQVSAGSSTSDGHCGDHKGVFFVKDYPEEAGRLFKTGDMGQVPYTSMGKPTQRSSISAVSWRVAT